MQGSETTHYELLGVAPDATTEEIRRAFLAAARAAHPDVAGPAGEEMMRRLNEAWSTLSDPEARAFYDHVRPLTAEERAAAQRRAEPATPPPGPTGIPAQFAVFDEADPRDAADPLDERTAMGPALQMLPPVLLTVGIVATVVGVAFASTTFVAGGLAVAVMGSASFVLVPMIAMARSRSAERTGTNR